MLLNASNALTSQPTACNFGLAASDDRTGEEEDDCGLPVAEGAVTVREQFLAAFGLLTADAPDTARTVFSPVSDLWAAVFPPTHSNACITYIQSARSFVEGLEGWASNRLKPGLLVTKPRGDARIFPNPTSGILTVKLPATACQLTVFDAFGRETARLEAAGEGVFDSAAWPSGLYTLEIREPGKCALREKVFVQKL